MVVITGGLILLGTAAAVLVGQWRQDKQIDLVEQTLLQSRSPSADVVDFGSFDELPPPVARYFRHVLTDGQPMIETAKLKQTGVLRTGTTSGKWRSFTASQLVVPAAPGFVWNAKVSMPAATHIRVLDSYSGGSGAGRVSLLSAVVVASESGGHELNSGSLHRYLAEGVWYPTALLPPSVVWSPIDGGAARATLKDRGTIVALEFRFNDMGEVTSIYAPRRFGRFDGGYMQVPWEVHIRDYEVRSGVRVPTYGEVAWYEDGVCETVWKGNLVDVDYGFR